MYNERFQGEGIPDWAVQDDGLPARRSCGFPANYFAMPALQHAVRPLLGQQPGPGAIGLQDRYAAAWRHVAARFRATRSVLGYELFNEPFPGTPVEPCLAGGRVPRVRCEADQRSTAASTRRSAPPIQRTLVWYEPNVLFNFGGADQRRAAAAIRAPASRSTTTACQARAAGTPLELQQADDRRSSNARERIVARPATPLLETEFGATNNVPDLTSMVAARRPQPDRRWLEWAYCGCGDPTTPGPGTTQAIVIDPAKPPAGANLELPTLRALVEPYPQVSRERRGRCGIRSLLPHVHARATQPHVRAARRGSAPAR